MKKTSALSNFRRILAGTCATALMSLGGGAGAATPLYWNIPGNACDALDGRQVGDISKDNGRATNTCAASRQVVCPLTFSTASEFAADTLRVDIQVEDQSPSETVSCTLHIRDLSASELQKKNVVLDAPNSDGAVHYGPSFVGVATGSILMGSAKAERTTYVWCRLPSNSSVLSISWMVYPGLY